MADRVSQETVEVVYKTSGAKARVSQEVAEVLYATGAARALVSQEAVEVLYAPGVRGGSRASQVAVEVLARYPKRVTPTFGGTSSLSATVSPRHPVIPTLAGTSALSATVSVTSGVTKNIAATLAGTSTFSANVSPHRRIGPTLAGTSTLTGAVVQTDYLTVELDGIGQIRIGPPGPAEIPVEFDGTSSLDASFGIAADLIGTSSLTAKFNRAQFVVQLHGAGHLTFLSDLGPAGARLSQITNEVAYVGDNPSLLLSQVTLEVARPRPRQLFQAASV